MEPQCAFGSGAVAAHGLNQKTGEESTSGPRKCARPSARQVGRKRGCEALEVIPVANGLQIGVGRAQKHGDDYQSGPE